MPFTPGLTAGSTIKPMSFVIFSGLRDFEVIQSALNGRACFVTQQSMQFPPGVAGSDQATAASGPSAAGATPSMPYGWPIGVFAVGDQAVLQVASTVAAGDPLKSDANGFGATAGSGDRVCAYALEAGTQSQCISVYVTTPATF
jgi:hypothetical protein